jgi:hypothetical protein
VRLGALTVRRDHVVANVADQYLRHAIPPRFMISFMISTRTIRRNAPPRTGVAVVRMAQTRTPSGLQSGRTSPVFLPSFVKTAPRPPCPTFALAAIAATIAYSLTCVKPRATVDRNSQRLITIDVMRPKRGVEFSGRQCGEL